MPTRSRIVPPLCVLALCAAAGAQDTEKPGGEAPPEAVVCHGAALTPLAHVEVRGHGPTPVVLIPGLACDWTVFRSFMDRNIEEYTMYAVTLPGFGGSAPPTAPPEDAGFGGAPWLQNAESAVVDMIRERGLDRPVVIGHSMGGHLALRIGVNHPEMVRSVVCIDGMPAYPLGRTGEPFPAEERERIAAGMHRSMSAPAQEQWEAQQRQWIRQMVGDPARGEELATMGVTVPRATTLRYMAELMASDIADAVKTSPTPSLLIAALPPGGMMGTSIDELKKTWRTFTGDGPNPRLAFFHDTRHFVMDDAGKELDRAIGQWVGGHEVDDRPSPLPGGAAPAE